MSDADAVHFKKYSAQNRAKHAILDGYLPAYLKALKGAAKSFHYIDGFAGRGSYGGQHPGSPLRALSILEQTSLCERSTISLVEFKKRYCTEVASAVDAHLATPRLALPPIVRRGFFSDHLDEILQRDIYRQAPCATFAFVDPCGVKGIRMKDLARILMLPFGEVLLFFNYSGVIRIIGQARKGMDSSTALTELLGSGERAATLVRAIDGTSDTMERESLVRGMFADALRVDSGVRFLVPFRFESRDSEATTHYLLHCCRDPLGFLIMKDVMWDAGRAPGAAHGSLGFQNDRERGKQLALLRFDIADTESRVLSRLAKGAVQVSHFTKVWATRPEDLTPRKAYRQVLLDLESRGRIEVFDKANQAAAPASTRRTGTLGPDYWLRVGHDRRNR